MDIAKAGMIGETKTLDEAVMEAFDRLDSRVGKDHLSISGIPTGYVDLDNITAGLQNSELVIVAARPSVGKTAFALNLVRQRDRRGEAAGAVLQPGTWPGSSWPSGSCAASRGWTATSSARAT